MGEPKPVASSQSNGGIKQKPTSLNLAPGSACFYRNVNGRINLNDRHIQHAGTAAGSLETGVAGGRGLVNIGLRNNNINCHNTNNNPNNNNNNNESGSVKSITSTSSPIFNESNNVSQLSALPSVPSLLSAIPGWNISAEQENLLESMPPPPPAPSDGTISHRSSSAEQQQQLHHHQQQQQLQQSQLQSQQRNNLQPSPIGQLCSPSNNGLGGVGAVGNFSLYTPPAPIPASGANKIRSTPNGLPQSTAMRRPHSIAVPPYSLAQFNPRVIGPPGIDSWGNRPDTTTKSSNCAISNGSSSPIYGVSRRAHSVASTPVSATSNGMQQQQLQQHQKQLPLSAGNMVPTTTTRTNVPPQTLWNGQLQQQSLPRRPHSIASTPVNAAITSVLSGNGSTVSSAGSCTPAGGVSANGTSNGGGRTPSIEPIQWGASGMVLHQPVPRRPYPTTLPHPQPPTPTSQGPALSVLTNPGNSNTWTPGGALRHRPHSIATTPQGYTTSIIGGSTLGGNGSVGCSPMPPASPSDSGYRSLPSSSSDYQLLKSPSQSQLLQTPNGNRSAVRRLSLPSSAQNLLRATAPRPSPTFHGLPFKPFSCGVSPSGTPIFLGCTHLHGNGNGTVGPGGSGICGNGNNGVGNPNGNGTTRASTPATSPAHALTTSQAIQQLLAQPRNGFKIVDDKVSLFIEILDSQERFAKVSPPMAQ